MNYQSPEDACMADEVAFRRLCDFENDLNRHIHRENNILFSKAIELEKQNSIWTHKIYLN